eukprot:jgi/Astpho2/8069/Aster-03016
MLADGYKLVAVGDHAERQLADSRTPKEVDVAGWNSSQESFSFQYVDSTGEFAVSDPAFQSHCRRTPVLVQAMPMGPKLLVHWLSTREQTDPQTLELDVDRYIANIDTDDIVAGFRHLDELCEKLNECLYATTAKPRTSAELRQSNRTEGQSSGAARGGKQGPGSAGPAKPGPHPAEGSLREPNFSSGPAPPEGRIPALLGDFGRGDMIPPGLPPMPHLPPGSGDFIPPGSGMMVGPDHPMFRQGRPRPGPGLPAHGGGVPGMRWDPIGPPGTPGFLPDDLQRPPPPGQVHPDLAPRGFRGPDWDSMYG